MLEERQLGLQTGRERVKAALDKAAAVNGHLYRPTTPRPGDAWPTLPSLELHSGLMWQATWTVIVFLPQDERAASEWMDRHFLELAATLRTDGFPVSAEPGLMPTSGGDQYVLEITMRSE